MSEAVLMHTGFVLFIVAVIALIIFLILNSIIKTLENKRSKPYYEDNENIDMAVELQRGEIDETFDLENKIVQETQVLSISRGIEEDMVQSGRSFLLKDVREITISKNKMMAVSTNSSIIQVIHFMISNGMSRCLVYHNSIDEIQGIVKLTTVLKKFEDSNEDSSVSWADCVDTVSFVKGSMSIYNAFNDMRIKNSKLAVVVDEYSKTIGVITEQDIIQGMLDSVKL